MSEESVPTVLVVEDQKGLAEAYTAVLSIHYDVRMATSGEEALEKADGDVDVILLDRRMPGMSGDDVLEALLERGVDARVAMLTAVEPTGDLLDMPCDDYVTKPIDNDDLIELVANLHAWDNYDDTTRELFRMSAKKVALEVADKQRSDEYEELIERMKTLTNDIDVPLEELTEDSKLSDLDQLQ